MGTLLLLSSLAFAPLAEASPMPGSGGGCSTVCSVDEVLGEGLGEAEIQDLLVAWQQQPMAAASLPLETLLFYAEDTRNYLRLLPEGALNPERLNFLAAELSRNEVRVEMRLVDDLGSERGVLVAQGVPLGEKQHLRFRDSGVLGPYITSGKVKRVGLGHLWSRW